MVELYDYQLKAIKKLQNGNILCGGVGSGKSRTSIAYYFFEVCKGKAPINGEGTWRMMIAPRDLYIITTAKKRDSGEWEEELAIFNLSTDQDICMNGVNVVIDSWNNIKKYRKVNGAFFIFDEQRVVGRGTWVKSFIDISRKNKWILLTATPGDTWSDYIPVFIANGFYKNRTEFNDRHCIFSRFTKWPQITGYYNEGLLERQKKYITVKMDVERSTVPHEFLSVVPYDKDLYFKVFRHRWDPYDNEPIAETGKLCYLLRRVVNDNSARIYKVFWILSQHPKAIIFYNFNYELEMMRESFDDAEYLYSEWNGQKHEEVPNSDEPWVYLVQYTAGAEGWNCITTDTIIFFSLNYSYKIMTQARGRIDRLNTPFTDLYYYTIRSAAPIDCAIERALKKKKNFNEKKFIG